MPDVGTTARTVIFGANSGWLQIEPKRMTAWCDAQATSDPRRPVESTRRARRVTALSDVRGFGLTPRASAAGACGDSRAAPKAEYIARLAPRERPRQQQARVRQQGESSPSELELTTGAPVIVPPSSVEKPSERHDHRLLASGAAHGAEQACTRGDEQRHEGQAKNCNPGSIEQTGQSGANYTQPEAEPSHGAVGADSVSRLNDPI